MPGILGKILRFPTDVDDGETVRDDDKSQENVVSRHTHDKRKQSMPSIDSPTAHACRDSRQDAAIPCRVPAMPMPAAVIWTKTMPSIVETAVLGGMR